MNLALLDSVQSARARGATTADVLGESSARRVLTTRDATWAIACARQLASLRVQPNAVSLGGVLFAMLAAGAFAVSPLAGPGMRAAMLVTPKADQALFGRIDAANATLAGLTRRLNGDPARQRLNESDRPSIGDRVYSGMSTWETRQMPTATQRRCTGGARSQCRGTSVPRRRRTSFTGPI
jgi:hypothetical protein